jgi:hypothetical protein
MDRITHKWARSASGATASAIGLAMAISAFGAAPAMAQDAPIAGLQNRTIGFALVGARWGIHQTEHGKAECPDGFNEGPREQFKALYPAGGTVEGTQLERESASRYPMDKDDAFSYREVKGTVAIGLDLDGKTDESDFVSPEGKRGVDNELYRAIGCTRLFRAPDGTFAHFTNMWVREINFNRILVEVSNVDSLENDDQVDVTMYRGKDRLMTDASGANIVPGGSNRVDARFGARFIHRLKGKIENGVLTTEPADIRYPWAVFLGRPGHYDIKGARLQVNLDPSGEKAEGLLAGYADVESWYQQLVRSWSTHHSSYGGLAQPSLYRVLHRLADGYPDEKGANTAISSSIEVKFVQVFIEHPDRQVAADGASAPARAEPSRR